MGPFFNIKQAAEYCGYKPRTFYRLLKNYVLPFHGPNKNRLAKDTLDRWMANPESFKIGPRINARKVKEVKL